MIATKAFIVQVALKRDLKSHKLHDEQAARRNTASKLKQSGDVFGLGLRLCTIYQLIRR
jgi:hypothetical protein